MNHQFWQVLLAWTLIFCGIIVLSGGEKWLVGAGSRLSALRPASTHKAKSDVAIVVASMSTDNTSWVDEAFPEWEHVRYVVDDKNAEHTTPVNKGHEAMVFLTYIIDHYDILPPTIIFSHAEQYQWHNDDPLFDGKRVLQHLQLDYVREQGYVNLRCDWASGCPVELRPIEEAQDPEHELMDIWDTPAKYYMKESFEQLFPGEPVPEQIGVPCCAQFAVSRDAVRGRPVSDYERMRQWIIDTDIKDSLSGRVFEYAWHIIMGKPPLYCLNVRDCYCRTYGLCELECDEEEGSCGWFDSSREFPLMYTIPDGWPDLDYDGNWQNVTELRIEQDKNYQDQDLVEAAQADGAE